MRAALNQNVIIDGEIRPAGFVVENGDALITRGLADAVAEVPPAALTEEAEFAALLAEESAKATEEASEPTPTPSAPPALVPVKPSRRHR